MNIIAASLQREIDSSIKAAGGLDKFRNECFQQLHLRTVMKESHGQAIQCLTFNHSDPGLGNLFASVGSTQATVYDDMHMGDYMGLVVNYNNDKDTPYQRAGPLTSCCWVDARGLTRHPYGDALLVAGSSHGEIMMLSVTGTRVEAVLHGHTKEVSDVRSWAPPPPAAAVSPSSAGSGVGPPPLLASLSFAEGSIRLWDLRRLVCMLEQPTDAITMEVSPCGTFLLTGHKNGRIHRWNLDLSQISKAGDDAPGAPSKWSAGLRQEYETFLEMPAAAASSAKRAAGEYTWGGGAGAAVDSMVLLPPEPSVDEEEAVRGDTASSAARSEARFLPRHSTRLAAKSADGHLCVWDLNTKVAFAPPCMRIPGLSPGSESNKRCIMTSTSDGAYLACGNSTGEVFVFDTRSGARVVRLACPRMGTLPVRAALVSDDGRHVTAAVGNGYIFRFEFVKTLAAPLPAEVNGANGSDVAAAASAAAFPLVKEPGRQVTEATAMAIEGAVEEEEELRAFEAEDEASDGVDGNAPLKRKRKETGLTDDDEP